MAREGRGRTFADALIISRVLGSTGRSEDEEPCRLPDTTNDQGHTTTELLHNVQTTEGAPKVNGAKDDLGDEGILNTNGLEDGSTVVEEVVGASELLERLETHPYHGV